MKIELKLSNSIRDQIARLTYMVIIIELTLTSISYLAYTFTILNNEHWSTSGLALPILLIVFLIFFKLKWNNLHLVKNYTKSYKFKLLGITTPLNT